jgi:hypothetical protein
VSLPKVLTIKTPKLLSNGRLQKRGRIFKPFFTKNKKDKKYNKIEGIWIRFSLNSERIVPRLDKDREKKLKEIGEITLKRVRLMENFRLVEDSNSLYQHIRGFKLHYKS